MTEIVIGILDNARSPKTVSAVKDWATAEQKKLNKFTVASDPSVIALKKCNKWLIAAAEAKKIDSDASKSKYETAKKRALTEAKRADALAGQTQNQSNRP